MGGATSATVPAHMIHDYRPPKLRTGAKSEARARTPTRHLDDAFRSVQVLAAQMLPGSD